MSFLLSLLPAVRMVKIYVITALAVALISVGGYILLRDKQLEKVNRQLYSQVSSLQLSLEVQSKTIETQQKALLEWKDAFAKYQREATSYARVQRQANNRQRTSNDVFFRHNLPSDAAARPQAVERRLNNSTSDAWSMLRCASGATGAGCPGGGSAPSSARSLAVTGPHPDPSGEVESPDR